MAPWARLVGGWLMRKSGGVAGLVHKVKLYQGKINKYQMCDQSKLVKILFFSDGKFAMHDWSSINYFFASTAAVW
jgi:hypothetical protein